MRKFLTPVLAATAALAMTAPAAAQDSAAMTAALANDARDEDRARDQFRNPAETLAFFQVDPGDTVVEYSPGGGWYTRLLVPYLAGNGQYIAVNADSDARSYRDRAQEGNAKSWAERFPDVAAEWTGVAADTIMAIESDEASDDVKGTVDRVLIFRSMHGLLNSGTAVSELRNLRAMLTDDGMVGVVQHRAKADHPYEMTNGSRGYLREQDVVNLFELNGFELVDISEVNANPKDPADWEGGVWTLPPVLRYREKDRAKYEAIGESDRMTLLFRKRD